MPMSRQVKQSLQQSASYVRDGISLLENAKNHDPDVVPNWLINDAKKIVQEINDRIRRYSR
jgi:hypothetical protein